MDHLRHLLENLLVDYHRPYFLSSDPLEFVHRYQDPWDQEAVALCAALLAYGNVKIVRSSVAQLLKRLEELGPSPSRVIRELENPAQLERARKKLKTFYHRFNQGSDLLILLRLLGRSWREHGSLGAHFLKGLKPDALDIGDALNELMAQWEKWIAEMKLQPRPSFYYLMTAPKDGSACKRWCMLLRWMGRNDELDPGLWAKQGKLLEGVDSSRFLKSHQLVIPLDTHTGRIAQYLGLTERKSLNFRAAREVTANLKIVDPLDPTRFDFSLSRLGILDLCQRKYRAEICTQCQLVSACKFAKKSAALRKARA